jgi:protease-4
MIGWPLRLLIRLLAVPIGLLLGGIRRLRMGRRAVVELVIGAEGRRVSLADRLRTIRVIEKLAADSRVRVLQVEIRSAGMGLAALQGLREALGKVRAAGKRIIVRMDSGDDRALYLASVADEIWMPPGGELQLTGLGASMMFFGPALQRLGLAIEVEAAGVYKSFGEPFYRGFPTAANRQATLSMLEDLQAHMVDTIAQGRGLQASELQAAMETGLFGAEEAAELRLIDQVGYADELSLELETTLGGAPRVRSLERYRKGRRLVDWLARVGRRMPQLALVYLQGPVVERVPGMGRARQMIASDEVVPVLDALREDKRIRGVVLVVESPGGSALASDLIARAVERLDAEKPVVASMESVAASGGYYIAAPTREIVARSTTLTGSIGVIGGKVVVGELLDELGVHTEILGPGAGAGIGGPFRRFTAEQRQRFQRSLRRVYARFIAVVATGRGRTNEQILEVAEGRVWTGRQASERHLVDHLGGLPVALERVRELAGLSGKQIREVHCRFDPPRFSLLNLVLRRSTSEAIEPIDIVLGTLGPSAQFVEALRAAPLQALALEPVPWDPAAWEAWR